MSPARFKKIRESLGLTQEELASTLGFSGKVSISNIETGFRKPSILVATIMEVLNELPARRASELIASMQGHAKKKKLEKND